MPCASCAHFTLHLYNRNDVGLCSFWVQVQYSKEQCNSHKARELPKKNSYLLTPNGLTSIEWRAVRYGECIYTGNKLPYSEILEICRKHGIAFFHVEKFKKQKGDSSQLNLEL